MEWKTLKVQNLKDLVVQLMDNSVSTNFIYLYINALQCNIATHYSQTLLEVGSSPGMITQMKWGLLIVRSTFSMCIAYQCQGVASYISEIK